MYAEIAGKAGVILARAEAEVSEDNDLATLITSVIGRFRRAHPDRSLLTDVAKAGLTIRIGSARKS